MSSYISTISRDQKQLEKRANNKYGRLTISLTNRDGTEKYTDVPIWKLDDQEVADLTDYEESKGRSSIVIFNNPTSKEYNDSIFFTVSIKMGDGDFNNYLIRKEIYRQYNRDLNSILKHGGFDDFKNVNVDEVLKNKTLKHTYLENFQPPFKYTFTPISSTPSTTPAVVSTPSTLSNTSSTPAVVSTPSTSSNVPQKGSGKHRKTRHNKSKKKKTKKRRS